MPGLNPRLIRHVRTGFQNLNFRCNRPQLFSSYQNCVATRCCCRNQISRHSVGMRLGFSNRVLGGSKPNCGRGSIVRRVLAEPRQPPEVPLARETRSPGGDRQTVSISSTSSSEDEEDRPLVPTIDLSSLAGGDRLVPACMYDCMIAHAPENIIE